jgi:hypothetical protein
MRYLNKAEKDAVEINNISEEDRRKHYRRSRFNPKEMMNIWPTERSVCIDAVVLEEVNEILKALKNRTALSSHELNVEVF